MAFRCVSLRPRSGFSPPRCTTYPPDKQKLYLAVMEFALRDGTTEATAMLHEAYPPLGPAEKFLHHHDSIRSRPTLIGCSSFNANA